MIKRFKMFLFYLYSSSLNLKYLKLTKMDITRFAMKLFIYKSHLKLSLCMCMHVTGENVYAKLRMTCLIQHFVLLSVYLQLILSRSDMAIKECANVGWLTLHTRITPLSSLSGMYLSWLIALIWLPLVDSFTEANPVKFRSPTNHWNVGTGIPLFAWHQINVSRCTSRVSGTPRITGRSGGPIKSKMYNYNKT